jgi:hypothetical protein
MYTATDEIVLHANDYKVAPIDIGCRFSREFSDRIVDEEVVRKATKVDDVIKVPKTRPIRIIMLQRNNLLHIPILHIEVLKLLNLLGIWLAQHSHGNRAYFSVTGHCIAIFDTVCHVVFVTGPSIFELLQKARPIVYEMVWCASWMLCLLMYGQVRFLGSFIFGYVIQLSKDCTSN